MIDFKADLCWINEDYILVKAMRKNEYFLFDFKLEKVNFHVDDANSANKHDSNKIVFTNSDLIVGITSDRFFVYAQDKGILKVVCRRTFENLNIVKVLDTSSLKVNVAHIKIDSKSRILIKLSEPANKMVMLNMNGELLCEARFEFLSHIISFELDASDCLSMLHRSKKSYFFI